MLMLRLMSARRCCALLFTRMPLLLARSLHAATLPPCCAVFTLRMRMLMRVCPQARQRDACLRRFTLRCLRRRCPPIFAADTTDTLYRRRCLLLLLLPIEISFLLAMPPL